MLLDTLSASLLGNLLTAWGVNKKGKGAIAKNVSEETKTKSQGGRIIRARKGAKKSTRKGQGIVRAGYGRPSSSASRHCSSKNNKADF